MNHPVRQRCIACGAVATARGPGFDPATTVAAILGTFGATQPGRFRCARCGRAWTAKE